jgi:phospholipase/lecithinase/hemolysin
MELIHNLLSNPFRFGFDNKKINTYITIRSNPNPCRTVKTNLLCIKPAEYAINAFWNNTNQIKIRRRKFFEELK